MSESGIEKVRAASNSSPSPLDPIVPPIVEVPSDSEEDMNNATSSSQRTSPTSSTDSRELCGLKKPAFEPSSILILDISNIHDAVSEIFSTGGLPNWLVNFGNLQILKAAKCGIVYIESWILELNELREVYLEQNHISTWPHFLADLPELEYICLDGNPCLEKAFSKSPTLRSLFFNWGPSKESYRSIPRFIRGPEWPVAASARMSASLNIRNFGYYCGGIYSLSTPADLSNNGFLTSVEPCPLQARLSDSGASSSASSGSSASYAAASPSAHTPPDWRKVRQSEILFNIFNDIDELLRRDEIDSPKGESKTLYVPVTGTAKVSFSSDDVALLSGANELGVYQLLWSFLKEEERYCANLRQVVRDFFSSKINSSTVASSFNTIFEWFPILCSSHNKVLYPTLRMLVAATRSRSERSISKGIDAIGKALYQVQSAYEWYARKLYISECQLDLASSGSNIYRDTELLVHAQRQIMKFGGLHGSLASHLVPGATTSTLDMMNHHKNIDVFKAKQEQSPAVQWSQNELTKPSSRIKKHPRDYLFLPLIHIIRYERVFTLLSRMDARFQPVKTACREIRRHVSYRRRVSLALARCKLLISKFRTTINAFEGYKWDAVVSVLSRSYLEKGILELKTNDVLDSVLSEPASFVKETFSEGFHRMLRFVCCGSTVQIWDEAFEHLVGTVQRNRVKAKALGTGERVQVVFQEVREVTLVSVKEFSAPYVAMKSDAQEFAEAFVCDKYLF